jgi:dipeptidyl aminopeptidase/acylaminoacyl peptidase
MVPEDIGALRHVEDPRVSPDGTIIAFTAVDIDLAANTYRRRIWLASADGSSPARPFSAGPDDRVPRWSPDGRLLAFSAGHEGGPHQICTLPVGAGGERVVVAGWPEPASQLAWSPDGSLIAFVARDRDPARYGPMGTVRKPADQSARRLTRLFSRLDNAGWVVDRPNHIVVVTADGSTPPAVLTPGPYEASDLAWSPDGAQIAFASARHETWDLDGAVDLWTVPLDDPAQLRRLTPTGPAYSAPAWSPDGTRLAYLCNPTPAEDPRHTRVGVLELSSGKARELAPGLDRNCEPYGSSRPPVWFGDSLLCGVEDAGNVHVCAVPLSGAEAPRPVLGGARWVSAWDWCRGTLAVAVSTPTTFPELVSLSVGPFGTGNGGGEVGDGCGERRLTNFTAPFVAQRRLGEPVAFVARSADGTPVPCWAMAPVAAAPGARYPTLLNVHGGPFTSYGNRFFDEFQLQAGAGFGVLYCNPRGSSGYEEAWGRAVRWPECEVDPGSGWGGVDFEDVIACVEEGCRRFEWADADRLGILGGSYGGYMTSWAIGHTDRFKAACSERACNNLLTLENSSDIAGFFRSYAGHSHLDDPAAFVRQSPITYVRQMVTPLLILHSEDDLRCPISQAEELFVALRLLGRGPVFVRFPGESHELSRSGSPRHRVERAHVILDWFTEQLG